MYGGYYYIGVQNDENSLAHHGIKGMKWGVRRYQNADGTLTSAGKKRYSVSGKERKELTPEQKAARDARVKKALKIGGGIAVSALAVGTIALGANAIRTLNLQQAAAAAASAKRLAKLARNETAKKNIQMMNLRKIYENEIGRYGEDAKKLIPFKDYIERDKLGAKYLSGKISGNEYSSWLKEHNFYEIPGFEKEVFTTHNGDVVSDKIAFGADYHMHWDKNEDPSLLYEYERKQHEYLP